MTQGFVQMATPTLRDLKLLDMVFLLASFDEFTLFLKIVLWIAIPLIIVSFTVTTILHYRQKKKNALKASNEDEEILVNEVVDISLVSRLQKEVLHYKRRIKELQHALTFAKAVIPPAALKAKVAAIQDEVSALNTRSPVFNGLQPENLSGSFGEIRVNGETGSLSVKHLSSGSLASDFGFSGSSVSKFEVSDSGVSDLGISDLSSTDLTSTDQPAPGFTTSDIDSPASAAYLHDLVNEQKNLVLFLQQQLESRIKAFHELEFQFRDNAAILEKMTMSYEHIKHQLDDSDAKASMYRIEKDSMQAQISRLENSLRELQEQHTISLKLHDQQPHKNIAKNQDTANSKPTLSKTAEAELAEKGHS